jgi:hypothetical protein
MNVLVLLGLAKVIELAQVGVDRISVGEAFKQVALAALSRAGSRTTPAPTVSRT